VVFLSDGVLYKYNATTGSESQAKKYDATTGTEAKVRHANATTWFDNYPMEQQYTQKFYETDSGSWTEHDGGVWDSVAGSDVLQGKWNTSGRYRGYWFMGSSLRNTVVGTKIEEIRIYMTRAETSGYSTTQNAVIRPHGYSSKPSSKPTFLGTSHVEGFAHGDYKWVTLPTSFHPYFEDGSAYGLCIYTSSTDNTNYMRFNPDIIIEVTWLE
jgi:hypothetical protein